MVKPPKLNRVCTTSNAVKRLLPPFCQILMNCTWASPSSHSESNHRLSPKFIHEYGSTFLLFYYTIFSTGFTGEFLIVRFLFASLYRLFVTPFVCAWPFQQTFFSLTELLVFLSSLRVWFVRFCP